MKKLICLFAIMAIVSVAVLARADDCDPNNGYVSTTSALPWFLNHDHDLYRPPERNPMGAGIDVVLFESDNPLIEEVTAEGRYDMQNDEMSAYVVVKVNAFKAIKGLFK